jgi:hypothetical protein
MEKEPFKIKQTRNQSQWSAIGRDKNTNEDNIQSVEMMNPIPPNEMQISICDPEATEETSFLESISIGTGRIKLL